MKKYLKTNSANKIILSALIFYLLSYFIHLLFHFDAFIFLGGFFLAIFVPGLAINNILFAKQNLFSKLVTAPIFTVFLFLPIYYLLIEITNGKISLLNTLILLVTLLICSFIITYKKQEEVSINSADEKKFISIGILAFVLVHIATTLAYRFIPEIDGYSDLLRIENDLATGSFSVIYRPLFTLLAEYVSIISSIPPYWLFKFGFLIFQIPAVYYLYQIIKKAKINNPSLKIISLLALVSVPAINLEIDYVRPNIVFISAILPFIYYLSQGLENKKKYFILSFLISTIGLFFHEFFVILFLVNLVFAITYFYFNLNNFRKTIFFLIGLICTISILINLEYFPFLRIAISSISNLINLILGGIEWKWWFLETYSNMDGFNLGWKGIDGIVKYYAYFLSPNLILILILYLYFLLERIKNNQKISSIEKVSLFIFLIGIIFAEFLPRINYKTLPDRFWPMISMSLVALTPYAFYNLNTPRKKILAYVSALLILIGVGGSIYVAQKKAGYISNQEYEAAMWIEKNIPEKSMIITQTGNSVMLGYFIKIKNYKVIIPPSNFFYKKETTEQLMSNNSIPEDEQEKITDKQKIESAIKEFFLSPEQNQAKFISHEIIRYANKYDKEFEQTRITTKKISSGSYILYSKDKFNNYYVNRNWWKEVNFYNADLEKFDSQEYELIYNNNDVIYIWRKK